MDGDKHLWDPKLLCRAIENLSDKLPPDLVERLLEPDNLDLIREFLLGRKEICVPNYTIDLERKPLPPYRDWVILEHEGQGSMIWDPTRISFFQSEVQKRGGKVKWPKLLKERNLKGKKLLNACLPEWLRHYISRIPDEWAMTAGGGIYTIGFVGTTFRDAASHRVVQCLRQSDGQWRSPFKRLDEEWGPNDVIAVLNPYLPPASPNNKTQIVS